MSEHDEFVVPEPDEAEESGQAPGPEAAGPEAGQEEPLSPVDLNTATVDELCQLPGIGETLAQRIVNYRVEVQPFREPTDIMAVSGVSDVTYERIGERLTVSQIETEEAEPEIEELPAFIVEAGSEDAGGDAPPEPEPVIEAETEEEPEPEPEPEVLLAEVEEEAKVEREFAPITAITEVHAKWGRLLLVGLVSALLGAVLALAVLYGLNGTLDLRTAAKRAIQAEAFRLDDGMNTLANQLEQLSLRLDDMQDMVPALEAAQADIQELGRDMDSAKAMLESVSQDLTRTQSSLASMDEEIAGLQDGMADMGQNLSALERQVSAMEERIKAMDEELQRLVKAAGRFDAFLHGLRQLLDESGPLDSSDAPPLSTPTAQATLTPAMEMTVIPLATPTPTQ